MNTKLRRTVVVLATTLASLAFLATPVSAGSHNATITGGTLTLVNGTTTFTAPLGGTTGAGCSSSMTIYGSHFSGTMNVEAFTATSHFTFNSQHWVAVITRTASATGSALNGVIGSPTGPTLTVNMEIYAATSTAATSTSNDCTPRATTRTCTLRLSTIAFGGSYTVSTTHGSMGSSSTYDVSSLGGGAITNVVGQTCSTPFNTFAGGVASITNMTGHFTTDS